MEQRIVFVVGTGRSGTHWLGFILDEHPDIVTTIEEPKVFERVTAMALDPSSRSQHLRRVLRYYRRQLRKAHPLNYADKSHPNIWLAEALAIEFGDSARFLGIERSPFAVAASSLQHSGVSQWNREWRSFPVPNAFLGITNNLASGYDDLTDVEKFGHRWLAHHDEMERLKRVLGSSLHVVDYEQLIDDFAGECRRLWDFLGVSPVEIHLPTQTESRDKWRDQLDESQIDAIARVTGQVPYV